MWFDDVEPFTYRSDFDKILLYYPKNIAPDNRVYDANNVTTYNYSDISITGMIQIQIDGTNIKVVKGQFTDETTCSGLLNQMREYFHEMIKTATNSVESEIDKSMFVLYWEPNMINETTKPLIKKAGLLTDDVKCIHLFTGSSVLGKKPNLWGSISQPLWGGPRTVNKWGF